MSLPVAGSLPSAGVLAALAGAAALMIVLLAVPMRRNPDLFPLLAVLALPFRLPISASGRTVNLLIPLYVVVGAGVLAHLLPRLPARRRAGGAPPGAERSRSPSGMRGWMRIVGSPRGTAWLLAASVALYALQTLYSADRAKGAENLVFFYIPFGLLFVILREVRWHRALLLRCLGIAVGLAVVFAGIGFIEYFRKSLFLNPKVVAANDYDNYFRVNSLFFDPNIYGRFLALVMIAVTTTLMWLRGRRELLIGAAVLAWLLCGLITSFSQSSIAALLLGLAMIAAWRWDALLALGGAVLVALLAGAVLLVAPASLHFGLKGSGGSTNNATNGRTQLISGGLELFAQRPLQGYGSGSFETEYRRHGRASAANATSASHTIPVTIAAEQGVLGLLLYVALLASSLTVLMRGAGRSPPRIALAACFAALVLHTWTYADFLEDPFTWTLLAIGLALAARPLQPEESRGSPPAVPPRLPGGAGQ